MRSLLPPLLNRVWALSCRPAVHRFRSVMLDPETHQRQYLQRLLQNNSNTSFGRRYGFGKITTVKEYTEQVPVTQYSDYKSFVDEIAGGKGNVLSSDPIYLFEPTSGSSGDNKLIPYNKTLKMEFARNISPWMGTMFEQYPGAQNGTAYWSISPPAQRPSMYGAIPVGFEQDADYLGPLERLFYTTTCAVPAEVVSAENTDDFMAMTLAHLLAQKELSFISIWSPTFLLALFDRLFTDSESVLSCLRAIGGRPGAVEQILGTLPREDAVSALWPKLALVSCWTDSSAAVSAKHLKRYLPCVPLQPKGLISTEAFISFPFLADKDPVLALESHFFEFEDTVTKEIICGHNGQRGKRYSVIVTTGGGLYRYRTGDIVEVTGHASKCPTLRFVRRQGDVSDLTGEKLHGEAVEQALTPILRDFGIKASFYLLAPSRDENDRLCYTLFIQSSSKKQPLDHTVKSKLEQSLRSNIHYDNCRNLSQLGPLRQFAIHPDFPCETTYLDWKSKSGIAFGDIKPSIMDTDQQWHTRFHGCFVGEEQN